MAEDSVAVSLAALQAKYVEKGGEFTAESFEENIGGYLKMNDHLNTDQWDISSPTNMHKVNLRAKLNAKCGALECKSFVPKAEHNNPDDYWADCGIQLVTVIGPLVAGKPATAIDEAFSKEQRASS